ncbi:hypothetical protein [Marixanthomonas spongiae]|nr:hypothetical protein [Marixanthomonas spongiae]
MKRVFILLLLTVSTTAFAQNKPDEPLKTPKIAIKVPLGETVEIDGHSVTFSEVVEDSRCPTSVTCVWQGRVKIKVKVEKKGKATVAEELIFGAVRSGEDKNHVFYISEDIKLEGMKVTPYPESENDIKENGYTFLVCAYN